jgi:multidrug transporter EmrE-like cation transporter
MSFSVELGLLFAVATAFASIVGFLMKHRGAVESPAVELRHPVRTSLALFGSRWYTLGIIVATGSWGLHVAALSLAPISLVQSVIAGGLVLLTVVADKVFGQRVTRREWICVALTAAGLAFLAGTLHGVAGDAHNHYEAGRLALYISLAAGIGLAAAAASRLTPTGGTPLAVAAGLLWGASDVSIKALSGHLGDGPFAVIHPLALVILVASLVGLAVSARSLQVGRAVPVIAVTSAAANLCTIAAGPIVFGEPMPDDKLQLALRLLAFALVIVASALTPPPIGDDDEAARGAPTVADPVPADA